MKLSLRLVVKITSLVVKLIPLGGDQVSRAESSGIGQSSYIRSPSKPPKGLHREPATQNCSEGSCWNEPRRRTPSRSRATSEAELGHGTNHCRDWAAWGPRGRTSAQRSYGNRIATPLGLEHRTLLPQWAWKAEHSAKALAQDLDFRMSNLRATEWNLPKNESHLKSPPYLIQMMFK